MAAQLRQTDAVMHLSLRQKQYTTVFELRCSALCSMQHARKLLLTDLRFKPELNNYLQDACVSAWI
jgi:hypothetical protein